MTNRESGISRYLVSMAGADHFAALESIASDLHQVQELITCCRACSPEFGKDTSVVMQACWSAAVIRYARCFLEGNARRIRSQDILDKHANADDRAFHDYLMTLRHNFFAHEGGLEQDRRIVAEMIDGKVIGIRTAGVSVLSLGTDLAELTFTHVKRVARWFNKEAQDAREDLLRTIRRDASAIEVLGTYVPKVFDLSPSDPSIHRLMKKAKKNGSL